MIVQRDCLPEGVVLTGRYEVRRVIYTTQVERIYEVFDRQEKREYLMKELYPSNYCSRGADGQVVIVRGAQNRSDFETLSQWFVQTYRQIAADSKTKGILKAKCLFSENNTSYVIAEKPEGERLSELVRQAGGKLTFEASVTWIRKIVARVLVLKKETAYVPRISKESLWISKQPNKLDVVFTEVVSDDEVLQPLGSLWYELLTGLRPQMASFRAPSELGVQLPAEAEEWILCCFGKGRRTVCLEELLSILPSEKNVWSALPKRQILLAAAAVFFAIAAWKSLLPKEKETLHAENDSVFMETETPEAEWYETPSTVSPQAIRVSLSAVEEETEQVETERTGNVPEKPPKKAKKAKKKEKKKENRKKNIREKQPEKVCKPSKPKSNLFDIW